MVKKQGRRGGMRSKLVEPYFQIKLGVVFVIVNVGFALLLGGLIYWVLSDVFMAVKTYFELAGADASLTMDKLSKPAMAIAVIVLAFIVTTFYVAVHYTHKIYGPLVSINRFVDELIENKTPTKLTLRDGDELQDLVEKLNILADKYKSKS